MVDHEKLRRVYKRKLKRLRLIDDSFMTRFFRGNIEGTKLLVRTILERSDLSIESVSTQETLVNPGRSVGLDILASDGSGALYNNRGAAGQCQGRLQARLPARLLDHDAPL